MAEIVATARESYRKLFLTAEPKTSTETMLARVKDVGMFVSNAYQRGDNALWQVFLRYSKNGLMSESGCGEDLPEALWHALEKAKASGFKNRDLPPKPTPSSPIAGDKTDSELTDYASPRLREMPPLTDEDIPRGVLGLPDPDFDALDEPSDDDDDLFGSSDASDDDDFL